MNVKRYSNLLTALLVVMVNIAFAQQAPIQFFRAYDQTGINVFETPREDSVPYSGFKFRLGANFKQQYQNLKHENQATPLLAFAGTPNEFDQNKLMDIGGGFNLAMANLNMDVQLADGVRVNLITYLSSRHHSETWVKAGYFQIDKVGFLNSALLDKLWQNLTLKVGHFEINYGDAHFRRSDGGNGIYNPFVENNIMDAFTTEIGGELYWRKNGFLAMFGMTDGEIQGQVTRPADRSPSYIGKLSYDKNFSETVRARLTASYYSTGSSVSNTLYGGDRTGSHYYMVTEPEKYLASGVATATTVNNRFTSGRINPGFSDKVQSFMINPFVKVGGVEFFGTYEQSKGRNATETAERKFSQYAGDVVYRFASDRLYVGARYNKVNGEYVFGGTLTDISVDRTAVAAGWFITKNILFKAEYVKQQYNDFPTNDLRHKMKFDGFMVEGIVGF